MTPRDRWKILNFCQNYDASKQFFNFFNRKKQPMKKDWCGEIFCTVAELIASLRECPPEALVFVEYDGHEQNATGVVNGYADHDLFEEDPEELGTPKLEPERYRTVRIRTGTATLVRHRPQ
jgi:hypothetical protein